MLKNLNQRLSLYLGCLLFLLASCQPVYVPNVVNIPLLEEPGDLKLSLHASMAGFEIQSAAALSDKFALMANGNFQNRNSNEESGFRNQNFGEVAAGYRTKIGKRGRFEAFGGIGYGTIKAKYETDNNWHPFFDSKYSRIFLQPNIGIISDIVDFGFAPRVAYVAIVDDHQFYNGLFIEPALSLKLGYKHVKGLIQIGLSLPVNKDQIVFDYNPFLFSIGLQFSLNFKNLKH